MTSQTNGSHKRTFHTLDALRGVAAVAVFVLHYDNLFHPIYPDNGGLAVDLFFMMSGVVIDHAYLRRLDDGLGVLAFLKIRWIRLYPVYALGLLLGAVSALASLLGHGVLGWTVKSFVPTLLLGLFMLPYPLGLPAPILFPLNLPTWSLFFEFVVNGVYGLVARRLTLPRLSMVVVASAALLAVIDLIYGTLDLGFRFEHLAPGFTRAVFGFFVGVSIARISERGHYRRSNLGFTLIALCTAFILFLPVAGLERTVWHAVSVLLLLPAITYAAVHVEPSKGLTGLATLIGISSYPLYILHYPAALFINSAIGRITGTSLETFAPAAGILLAIAFFGLSLVVEKLYDRPARRLLLNALDGPDRSKKGAWARG